MEKIFNEPADLVLEEGFLDWYYEKDSRAAKEWKEWIAQHPAMEPMVLEAIELVKLLQIKEKPVPVEQINLAWSKLSEQLDAEQGRLVSMKSSKNYWWWAAAILLVLAGAGIFQLFLNPSPVAVTSGYGQLVEQELPDGSLVTLNGNSRLQIGKGFNQKEQREVWLKGEAFFHVKKTDGLKRFVVHTDRFDVVVTGTQFNVINRGEKTSVFLTEGSVFLQLPNGNELKMKPGEYIELNSTDQFVKKDIQPEKALAWKDHKLMFDNTALPVAVEQIMDLFEVNITIEDKAAADTATISGIVPNDNLDVLIAALEAATGLTATKVDAKNITLKKQR
jgi:transmembrane sensor